MSVTETDGSVASAITRATMFGLLLAADPSFTPAWEGFLAEWSAERELPLYLACADLARHLISQLERGDTHRFNDVFDVVEAWHLHGDAYVRTAATIGLLEDLQNTNLHSRTTPAQFVSWLKPVSLRRWEKVEAFWSCGAPITDD